ncbi:protein rep, partial [Staphylococcus aureus]|uniref:protein rep n=1 Tax=Staphylococcus aureus TaxID=1280 RepID=UPI0011A7719B
TKTPKQPPSTQNKIHNLTYPHILQILKIKNPFNLKQSPNILQFNPTHQPYFNLHNTSFSKSKLSPLSNSTPPIKNTYQPQKLIQKLINQNPKPPSFFLTLSTKNPIHPHTLQQTFNHLTKPFHTFTTYKNLKQNLLPFIPSTQLTLNKNHPTYNHHIHLFLSLQNPYFTKKHNYITQQQSLNLSQTPLQLHYPPLPNLKPIKPNTKPHKHIQSAIKDTSKYSL